MDEKPKNKRLFVVLDRELHDEIKVRAIKRGITLGQWLIRAVMAQIKKEQEYE